MSCHGHLRSPIAALLAFPLAAAGYIYIYISSIVVLSSAVGCVYMSSQVDYEKGVDYSRYQTFSVERTKPLDAEGQSERLAGAAWVDDRTSARIRERLEDKGLTEAPAGEADLNVGYHYVSREEIRSSDRPGHVRWLRVDVREIVYETYTRGTLVVDFVDREQNLLVWHGAIEGVVKTPEKPGKHLDENLERAVDLLLRHQYPPG